MTESICFSVGGGVVSSHRCSCGFGLAVEELCCAVAPFATTTAEVDEVWWVALFGEVVSGSSGGSKLRWLVRVLGSEAWFEPPPYGSAAFGIH
ncbi:predicted protein [Arabidopsis lyrata subsp. lyrata]|uniref:Predicted protein n=1 Tax=Arabidopsis lyrata subsp. lyrata TaxID=81972 RepID=D7M4A9_ARALL|nr:predicted protein [Arabidopsis lyrata subsp. lyrata]